MIITEHYFSLLLHKRKMDFDISEAINMRMLIHAPAPCILDFWLTVPTSCRGSAYRVLWLQYSTELLCEGMQAAGLSQSTTKHLELSPRAGQLISCSAMLHMVITIVMSRVGDISRCVCEGTGQAGVSIQKS